ncbi:mechanosensitive ion channel family protein [Candidatus Poribacteria bacterium]|nr:mechanosensitive ion channel family protein [Candidatus Poribacteria bacterium]MYA58263.1 mechanosensitive ion channel family protein [Candidatus Poribacteria bacterium]
MERPTRIIGKSFRGVVMSSEVWQAILNFKYISVVWMVLVGIGTVIVYFRLTSQLRKFTEAHAYKPENADRFFFMWRYVFMFSMGVLIIFLFSDVFGIIGLSLAFIMTLMGWGIRNPIMNLAAWLLIILQKPYRIGDRVILGTTIGDVRDISIMYTQLDQVGGTIGGEEKSGRSVMIPNQHLFRWNVINYTRDEKYILDEVIIRLTYRSDITRAEQIMCEQAAEVTADICEETGESPYVRFEFIPSGVVAKLRYRVSAVKRQSTSTLIVERISKAFRHAEQIEFAYVKSETLLIPKNDELPPQYLHIQ